MDTILYIAHWEQTKWLVISSSFFLFPCVYAYCYSLYNYSILLLFTSIISANYWRKATISWRRSLDLFFAKVSFFIFFSQLCCVRQMFHIITGYSGLVCLLYCYYLSDTLFKLKNENWIKYHLLFHIFVAFEQLIIVDSILSIR